VPAGVEEWDGERCVIARIYVRSTGRSWYAWEQWLAYGLAVWLVISAYRHARRAIRIVRSRRDAGGV
jgi:hypothetical protein